MTFETFDFEPRIVFIVEDSTFLNKVSSPSWFLFLYGVTKAISFSNAAQNSDTGTIFGYSPLVSFKGNSIQWYSCSYAVYQANYPDAIYKYLAVG